MGFAEGLNAGNAIRTKRDESRRLAALQNAELRASGFNADGSTIAGGSFEQKENLLAQQVALQSQQLKRMQGAVYAQDTANAVDNAVSTGNWAPVQRLFDENPDLGKAWQGQGVHRVDSVNFDIDAKLLGMAQVGPEAYDTPEKRLELSKKIFKIDKTGKGDWELRTVQDILATTNVAKKLSFSQLDNINRLFQKKATAEKPLVEDKFFAFHDSYKDRHPDASLQEVEGMYEKTAQASLPPTGLGAFVRDRADLDPNISPEKIWEDYLASKGSKKDTGPLEEFITGYKSLFPKASSEEIFKAFSKASNNVKKSSTAFQDDLEYIKKHYGPETANDFVASRTGRSPTSATKELDEVDKVRDSLERKYPNFYTTNFKQGTKEYREVEREVQKLERYLGIKPSESERRDMAEIKATIAMAKVGTKLTEKDTGMLDNLVGNIKKYVSKDTPPESRAAYSQMMTSIRNALYGATLPAAEMASYTQAFSSLSQQLPAVQTAMLPALKALKAKFETLQDTGDEAVTHFRLGVGRKELDNIINNLDGLISGSSRQGRPITPTRSSSRPTTSARGTSSSSSPIIKEWQGKRYKQLSNGDWAEVK